MINTFLSLMYLILLINNKSDGDACGCFSFENQLPLYLISSFGNKCLGHLFYLKR